MLGIPAKFFRNGEDLLSPLIPIAPGRSVVSLQKTVLIVGGGGREHAIAWKLAQSPHVGKLYAAPGNAGIAELATCEPVAVDDVAGQVNLAQDVGADLVVIGPELPLSLGLVDALQMAGIAAVGPTRDAARIESSKQFAKEVMAAAGIPTAAYDVVTDVAQAEAIIRAHFATGGGFDPDATWDRESASGASDQGLASSVATRTGPGPGPNPTPLVLKADGLAAGKGVIIAETEQQALGAARDMLSGQTLGGAGTTVVLEQFLTGPEVSLLAFCDGERALPMPFAQDYKRLLTGDEGPNTGGMGSISPVPGCGDDLHTELVATCVQPLLDEMVRRGTPFRGILFAGLMLTPSGPMVLEYNARFGDPETQSLLRRLDSDLFELLLATAEGDLSKKKADWSSDAACCVVMAAPGYPDVPERGVPITDLPAAVAPFPPTRREAMDDGVAEVGSGSGTGLGTGADSGSNADSGARIGPRVGADFGTGTAEVVVFHGGTARDAEGRLVSAGGRVLGVTARGTDVNEAVERAYAVVEAISFPGNQHRTDIGASRRGE